MLTNADITIINKWKPPDSTVPVFAKTVIYDINWHSKQASDIGDKGLRTANKIRIRIPEESPDKKYIEVDKYKKLDDITGYWTLDEGDKVVKGVVTEDIDRLSDIEESYSKVCTITAYSENLRGGLPHWKIESK